MIFVTLGSQRFQFNRLLKKLDELVENKVITEPVFAQIGYSDYKPVNYEYKDFIDRSEYLSREKDASVVITHGGTGAIVSAVKQGKKVIAVPRYAKYGEHVDDHQLQILKEFDEMNFIAACYEIEDLAKVYKDTLARTFTPYKTNQQVILNDIDAYIQDEDYKRFSKVLFVLPDGLVWDSAAQTAIHYCLAMERKYIRIDFFADGNIDEEVAKVLRNNGLIFFDNKGSLPPETVIRNLVKENDYNIVHVFGNDVSMSKYLKGAKQGGCKIRIAHTYNAVHNKDGASVLSKRRLASLCSERFASGFEVGKLMYGNRVFAIIPNAADLESLAYNSEVAEAYKNELGVSGKTVIGFVGPICEQKNYAFLPGFMSAFLKKNSNAVLVIVGNGSSEDMTGLRKMIDSKGLMPNVIIREKEEDISGIINAFDVCIIPSKAEGISNTSVECQANGLKAVLSDTVTKECNVTDSLCFVNTDDVDAWVDTVYRITSQEYDRKELSETNCKILHESGYDIADGAKKLKKYYYELMPR